MSENNSVKAIVSQVDWCLQAMMTGPAGRFSSPITRCVRPQVTRSHHSTNTIQARAQAITTRRGASKSGAPARANSTEPRYQPTLKASERSQRPELLMLVGPVLVS